MKTTPFVSVAHAALASAPISSLLSERNAIVLERLARGGGATRWYFCQNRQHLDAIESRLAPGSAVSFYFDDRIQNAAFTPELVPVLKKAIDQTGDVVIGTLREDGLELEVEFVDNAKELAQFATTLPPGTRVFYGAFPGRENDGITAVTIILPDQDGIVRQHPH